MAVDRKTNRPSVSVEYDVATVANGKVEYDVAKVANRTTDIHILESTDDMGNIGDQMTLKKALSTANLQPGEYNFRIKVHNNISHQVFERSTTFTVE